MTLCSQHRVIAGKHSAATGAVIVAAARAEILPVN